MRRGCILGALSESVEVTAEAALLDNGSLWMDEHLLNGEQYVHQAHPHPVERMPDSLATNCAGLVQSAQAPPFQVGDARLLLRFDPPVVIAAGVVI